MISLVPMPPDFHRVGSSFNLKGANEKAVNVVQPRVDGFRFSNAIAVLFAVIVLTAIPSRAQILPGQDTGNTPQPAPITPAQSAPPSATPPELLFPQSNAIPTAPQTGSQQNQFLPAPVTGTGLGYRPLGTGDYVDVSVFGAPEYAVHMPVSASGDIAIPYMGIFHVAGMTSVQAADAIADLFDQRQILRDAHVIVTTQQAGYSTSLRSFRLVP
jgi:hypothetical protein